MATALTLETRHVGEWGMNTYALICTETNQSVLIDPGDDPAILQEMLGTSDPIAILLTHTHSDHVGALQKMRTLLNVPVYMHDGPIDQGEAVKADHFLADGDTFVVGNHTLTAIYTPGHIGNQICFAIAGDDRIVVGDTIFEGGPGRTWDNDQFKQTLVTLRTVVLGWSDDAVCYPGHGPSFRLGDIRTKVTSFIHKDHGDFHGDAEWDM